MKKEPVEEYKLKLKDLKQEFPSVYKKIDCPSCSNSVPADNININDKIAKCNSCDVVFPFHESVANFNPNAIKQEVLKPEGIDLFYFQDELDITMNQPWRDLNVILRLYPPIFFFTALLPAIIFKNIFWITTATVLLLMTFYVIYDWIFKSRNKVYINIDDKFLSLIWRPKRFKKDQHYHIEDIEQLYIKSFAPHSKQYTVFMIVNGAEGQKHIPLINRLSSRAKAQYLEQEIEKQLKIVDKDVPESKW